MTNDCFTVFCRGKTTGGDVTFWKNGTRYYYQSDGIGKKTRCSKNLYDEARALYKRQAVNRAVDRVKEAVAKNATDENRRGVTA